MAVPILMDLLRVSLMASSIDNFYLHIRNLGSKEAAPFQCSFLLFYKLLWQCPKVLLKSMGSEKVVVWVGQMAVPILMVQSRVSLLAFLMGQNLDVQMDF